MNSLWIQSTPGLPSLNHSYEYNTSNKNYQLDNTVIDQIGCSSYTLSFGHLFSGDLYCYQSVNPIHQCYELPNSYCNSLNNIQSQQNPIIHQKVDEAMKTIRKTIKNVRKPYDYPIPSVPYCYNPIMNNCNQNNITKAAVLLEGAANAMSFAVNAQNQFHYHRRLLFIAENLFPTEFLNLEIDLNDSVRIRNLRKALSTYASILPRHRQIIFLVEWTNEFGEKAKMEYLYRAQHVKHASQSIPEIYHMENDFHSCRPF